MIQQACAREFERLWQQYQNDIAEMLAPTLEKYKELRRRCRRAAVAEAMTVLETIEIKKETPFWDNHLIVDKNGKFGWKAGSWERTVLEAEMQRPDFAGFLRNIPRSKAALCLPYGAENDRAFYPDLLIFRRRRNGVSIDLLEPHGDQFADHLSKAQGLARYAKEHGDGLGASK